MVETWWKETVVTEDNVKWIVCQKLTGAVVPVAECQFEQFADAIIHDHESAPELLSALEAWQRLCDNLTEGSALRNAFEHYAPLTEMRAAIRKARGEVQP